VNLAAPHREIHPGKRLCAGKGLRYAAHLKDCGLIIHVDSN
jgi:hypothetical protein